jgi:hypothetical protein
MFYSALQHMEDRMTTSRLVLVAVAAVVAMPALYSSASAQQSAREAAWHACLIEVNQSEPRDGSGRNDQARTALFKACMAKKGIRP